MEINIRGINGRDKCLHKEIRRNDINVGTKIGRKYGNNRNKRLKRNLY